MKIEAVVINDEKAKKYFAFIRQFPGVCAQADSIAEIKIKMEKHFQAFKQRISNQEIQFNEAETF